MWCVWSVECGGVWSVECCGVLRCVVEEECGV